MSVLSERTPLNLPYFTPGVGICIKNSMKTVPPTCHTDRESCHSGHSLRAQTAAQRQDSGSAPTPPPQALGCPTALSQNPPTLAPEVTAPSALRGPGRRIGGKMPPPGRLGSQRQRGMLERESFTQLSPLGIKFQHTNVGFFLFAAQGDISICSHEKVKMK